MRARHPERKSPAPWARAHWCAWPVFRWPVLLGSVAVAAVLGLAGCKPRSPDAAPAAPATPAASVAAAAPAAAADPASEAGSEAASAARAAPDTAQTAAAAASVSPVNEWRCGWFENPTPGNAWLTDRHGQWLVGVQGGHQADGDWPSFSNDRWVRSNRQYGYGCACLRAVVDAKTMQVLRIIHGSSLPLEVCRNDPTLPRPETR